MSGWSGFTDEELSRLKDTSKVPSKSAIKSSQLAVQKKDRKVRQQKNQKTSSTKQANDNVQASSKQMNSANSSNSEQKTAAWIKEPPSEKKENEQETERCCAHKDKYIEVKEKNQQIEKTESSNAASEKEEEKSEMRLLTETDALKIQMSGLEKLQKKQKEIEEENKLRRKIIKDTISERYKKAQVEASTLQTVQKELSHLDCLLANDVEILRNKIEDAAISFSHAQKRYEKAEKEFVDAKLDLQLKRDKKDQLTQHLYTIIQENELRKAKKLDELLGKLNMQESKVEQKDEKREIQNAEKTESTKVNNESKT